MLARRDRGDFADGPWRGSKWKPRIAARRGVHARASNRPIRPRDRCWSWRPVFRPARTAAARTIPASHAALAMVDLSFGLKAWHGRNVGSLDVFPWPAETEHGHDRGQEQAAMGTRPVVKKAASHGRLWRWEKIYLSTSKPNS